MKDNYFRIVTIVARFGRFMLSSIIGRVLKPVARFFFNSWVIHTRVVSVKCVTLVRVVSVESVESSTRVVSVQSVHSKVDRIRKINDNL